MTKKIIYALLLGIGASGMFGCQKFYVMDTIQKDDQLIFNSNEILKICDGSIYVKGLGIEYIGEKEQRVAWRVARKKTEEWKIARKKIEKKGETSQELPLKYGEKRPGFEISVKPMEILPGEYNIGSDIACYSGNEIRSLSVFGSFTIDASKNLVLDQDSSK